MPQRSIYVALRKSARTGEITVFAPDCPEINGKSLEQVWSEGWRPREYDEGHVMLVRTEEEDPSRRPQ